MLMAALQTRPLSSFTDEPVKVSDLMSAFLSGRSTRTLKAYSQDLVDFRSFAGARTTEEAARSLLSQGHGNPPPHFHLIISEPFTGSMAGG